MLEQDSASVSKITVTDILEGHSTLPFISPSTWKGAQHDCPSLRRTYAHLSLGTRPTKKDTHIRDVKRYLKVCVIGKNGLLVTRCTAPFQRTRDLTVLPRHVLCGLLSALHLRLNHPTKAQTKKVFHQYFFALDANDEIDRVCNECPQCA